MRGVQRVVCGRHHAECADEHDHRHAARDLHHGAAPQGCRGSALAGVLAWLAIARTERARHALRVVALVLGAALLMTLAFVGHAAAAGHGVIHLIHATADMLHLASAAGWIGALPALVFCLAQPLPVAELIRLTMRFSMLGIVCVVVLAASGAVEVTTWPGSEGPLVPVSTASIGRAQHRRC